MLRASGNTEQQSTETCKKQVNLQNKKQTTCRHTTTPPRGQCGLENVISTNIYETAVRSAMKCETVVRSAMFYCPTCLLRWPCPTCLQRHMKTHEDAAIVAAAMFSSCATYWQRHVEFNGVNAPAWVSQVETVSRERWAGTCPDCAFGLELRAKTFVRCSGPGCSKRGSLTSLKLSQMSWATTSSIHRG